MKQVLISVLVLVFLGTFLATTSSAVQSGGHPPQPWSKTCDMGSVGTGGCTVSVTMTASSDTSCPDGGAEYCVTVSVACPGDPAENCDSPTDCDVCGYGSSPVAITCDGQCFSAQPKSQHSWDDVASDCGNLAARDSGHPCQ